MQAFARKLYRNITKAQNEMQEHAKLRIKNAGKPRSVLGILAARTEEVATVSFAELPPLIRDNVISSHVPTTYAPASILQQENISPFVTRVTRIIPETTTRIDVFFMTGPHCASTKQMDITYTMDMIEMYMRVLEAMKCRGVMHTFKSCRQTVEIVLLPTLSKKQMDMDTPAILGPSNVNSGVTFKSGEGGGSSAVLVFRHEEMFKVLLHELLHLYDFDYFETPGLFDNASFKREYKIETAKLGLNESFNDALTLSLYLGFYIAVKEPRYMTSFTEFYKAYRVHFNHLRSYLVKMSAKLRLYQARHFNGETREGTHVFAYYHGKAALFSNSRHMFDFFKKYDNHIEQTPKSVRTYIRLLKESLNSKVYKAAVALHMQQLPSAASDFFYRTLRMCNFDLQKKSDK